MALYTVMKGPVDYTVVGSPTITDGVMTGFNANNYLKFDSITFAPGSGPFEFQLDYTTGASATDYGYSLCLPCINVNQPGGIGKFRINITTTTENFYLETSRAANTNYVLKVTYDGNGTYSLYANGVLASSRSSTQLATTSAAFDYTIGIRENSTTASINLNNTYIKVNDQVWFGHAPQRVKIRTAPYERYTVVGSPTITTEGVASGFSSSNVLRINNFDPTKPFVISTKIRFTETGERQYFVGVNTAGKIRILIFTDQKLLCNLGGAYNFNIGEIKSTQELSVNTDYFVKLEFTGSKYILSLSEDNTAYSVVGELVSSAYINGGNKFNLQLGSGNLPSAGFYFRGSIDLNYTYIKVNGQYWWRGDMQYVETYTLHQGE